MTVKISAPPMQRKSIGENCQFRWKVTGNITAYTVKLLISSTQSSALNTNLISKDGVITLFIWKIQLSNAGYYTVSISTGPVTNVNSTVLLFVYGQYSVNVRFRNATTINSTFERLCLKIVEHTLTNALENLCILYRGLSTSLYFTKGPP